MPEVPTLPGNFVGLARKHSGNCTASGLRQACARQKLNVLRKKEALSPPISFADAGKSLSRLENTVHKLNKNSFPSYLIPFQHYLKELDI